jgi:hypothetical protein
MDTIMWLHVDWFASNLAFNHSLSNFDMFGKIKARLNPMLGTSDFSEYVLKVTYFPSTLDFLILDGASSGDAFFDHVQVTNFN